jgi:ABC-type multidrug transport system ATPase subunit
MKITLTDAGKRFNRDWIFRHLSYEFSSLHSYAITGPNGSGKSTLLQVIAGAIGISEGSIRYELASAPAAEISPDQVYRYLSLSAPYLELIEEMTATEFLRFHHSFKPFLSSFSIDAILASVGLESAAHKQIRFFSSGMKQRIKLAQALFADTPIVLLDEPCTNLDADGISLYQRLVSAHAGGRMIIVSSNDPQEYDFCDKEISLTLTRNQ